MILGCSYAQVFGTGKCPTVTVKSGFDINQVSGFFFQIFFLFVILNFNFIYLDIVPVLCFQYDMSVCLRPNKILCGFPITSFKKIG